MRGSVTTAFAVLCAGIVVAVTLWQIRQVNLASKRVQNFEEMRAQNADLEARLARLEGENTKMVGQIDYLKELATGRKDISDLTEEIRTMVWVLAGPNARSSQEARRGEREPPMREPPAR